MVSGARSVIVRERRTLACENRKFEVFLDRITETGGETIPEYMVVAPKQKTGDLVTGVAVLPIFKDQVALIKMYRPAMNRFLWEIPRGFVNQDENETIAIARELEEETGILVASDQIRSLGYIAPEAGVLAARIHVFSADCTQYKPFTVQEMGHEEIKLVSFDEFEKMVFDGEIEDPSTLISFYRYQREQRK